MIKFIDFCEVWFLPESVARVAAIVGDPHASALIQRDFGCVLGERQTKQLPHVAKVDLVWQLGVLSGSILEQPWATYFLSTKHPKSEPAREAIQSGD
ncbi:hypothetical protein TNCV_127821 [Trichonephila clavipes]|nr:hypothetical protein TNCV_127821 [Trichonephila clavipes]